MKIVNKLALIPDQESKKYVSDYAISYVKSTNINEKNVDSLVHNLLLSKLGFEDSEAELAVTKLRGSGIKIPSKTVKASGTGEIDCAVFINDILKVIIEDKEPNESVDKALEEAITYADGLNIKGEDIRVVIGFTGLEIKVRVLDHSSNKWVPFFINGVELKAFIGKNLLELIYTAKDIHGIKIEEVCEDINIQDIIGNLKTIYRSTDLQNDNQKTIDFTIAFIGLRSVFEKYKNQHNLKTWEDLNNKPNARDNNIDDDEDLRDNIMKAIDKILDKVGNEYTDLFINKDSENIETFNFRKTLETFKTTHELSSLRKIYIEISRLHDLHDSKIDLFGEVYESLGDKNTKKAFGQYFTRRHIIKSLIDLMEVDMQTFIGELEEKAKDGKVIYTAKSPKTICDPACGTGGFLTEFFKHIMSMAQQKDKYKELNLSDLAAESFYGYDIYTSNVTRTKINMYLAGDGFSEIRKADTLQDQEIKNHNNKFDYIITNPPYGKGTYTVNFPFEEDSKIVNKPVVNSQRLEVNFLIKIVDMLKPTGKAMVIIPDGILEATTLSPLREWFLKYCRLEKVVSLPKHAFAPYTHEKTYAIFFEKRYMPLDDIKQAEQDPDVWTYIVDNDGFANSDKRFKTDRMDENGKYLHDEFSQWRGIDGSTNNSLIVERFKRKTQSPSEEFFDEWNEKIEGKKYGYITMSEILEDEFISYSTVSGNDVLKKINRDIESNIDILKLFSNENLTEAENKVKIEILPMLEENYQIFYDNELGSFIDRNKPVIQSLNNKELCELINGVAGDELKIKHPNDMLNISADVTDLKSEYVEIIASLGLDYDFLKKTPKYWKVNSLTFKVVTDNTLESKIKKIFTDYFLISDINKIIDSEINEVREEYEDLINEFNLEYDSYEKKWFDLDNKIIRKTLILTPEKYLRQEKVTSISLSKIKEVNKNLFEDLKSMLKTFTQEV
jgi:type I restriction-modification system DNA methylase subunit